MRSRLIAPDDPAWETFLRGRSHDFYHVPSYTVLAADVEGGEPHALLVEDGAHEMLLPLVVRQIPGSSADATSPYGHPGPLTNPEAPAGFLGAALEEGCAYLAQQGLVSLFLRLHPILNATPPSRPGTIVRHGDTISIDLSLPPDELERQTRRNHRQQIRQAKEAGYRVYLDESWRHFSCFERLYRETMERLGARNFYFFPSDYFRSLRDALGPRINLAVVEFEADIVAAMLVVETEGIVVTHLSGSDASHNRYQPTKLIYAFVRDWAKDRGNRWVQLGGGYGGNEDSLLHFKCGFSPLRLPYYTLRHRLRPGEYQRLVDGSGSARAGAGTEMADSGYFPAYRAMERTTLLSIT